MPDISVPWGTDELTIALPSEWEVQQIAAPDLREAPADWPQRLALALNQPGSGPPLGDLLHNARHGQIVLVVEDVTRHSPLAQILEIVMREIRHAHIGPEQLQIIFATGMHPRMTPAQAFNKLALAGAGMRWRSNPWHDPTKYVLLGRAGNVDVRVDRGLASADLRIVISAVAPHLQAGFGGGYKMFLPGCAALETIRGLHRLGIARGRAQLVGTTADLNPMRAAIDMGGKLVDENGEGSFAVQYLLDEQDRPAFIATGQMIPTQRMLAKQCSVACGVVTGPPADVLITNAHPLDFDLWQSFKCIPNTSSAVRPGGAIICLSRCAGGASGMKAPPLPLSGTLMRRIVRAIGPEALTSLLTRLVPSLASDAVFFVRLALQTIHRNPVFFVCPPLHSSGAKFPGLDFFGSPEDAIQAAREILGPGRQRVIVFPAGGTSFPVRPATSPAGAT